MRRVNQTRDRRWWLAAVAGLAVAVGLMAIVSWRAITAQAQGPNYALRFYGHGVNDIDRVKIPIDPEVPADVGGDFTIEFWMKANDADNQNTPFVSCGTFLWVYGNIIVDRDIWTAPTAGGDFGISMYEGKIRFGAGSSSLDQTICGSTRVDDGQWHHIAVTRRSSSGQMRIFVDGQQDGQGTGPTGNLSYPDGRTPGQPNDPYLVIGAEKHDAGSDFPSYNGLIDELRLSNVVRYSSSFSPPGSPFSPDGSTVALYHFNEGPGNCTGPVVDSSGATGGPSNGTCEFGGSSPAGPLYTTDTPFGGGGGPPTATPTHTATPTPDTAPPVISTPTAAPLDTIATINWETDEPTTSQVTYGISPTLSMTTTETATYNSSHGILLTNLISNTTYVYQVRSRDAAGNQASSSILNFTTLQSADIKRLYLPLVLK